MKRMYLVPALTFLRLRDVSHVQFLPGGGHQLHDPDGAHPTFSILVKLRLLVALRSHQQPVYVVLVTVFLKILGQRQELLALLLGSRIFYVFNVLQVARQELIAGHGPDLVTRDEIVERRFELRLPLRNAHATSPPVRTATVR